MISKLKIDIREMYGVVTVSLNSPEVFATFSADEVEITDHRGKTDAGHIEAPASGKRDHASRPG